MEIYLALIPIGLLTFLASLWITDWYIKKFSKQVKQVIREDAPERHKEKEGTPTMGGVVFAPLTLILGLSYLFGRHADWNYLTYHGIKELLVSWIRSDGLLILPLLIIALGNFLLGFWDDLMKVLNKRNLGLKARHKFLAHLIIVALTLWVYLRWGASLEVNLGYLSLKPTPPLYFVWLYLVISGTSNALNLTDGLDGLAATLSMITLGVFVLIGSEKVKALSIIGISALGGFLYHNAYPAKVFMGDSGSLFLGGFIATLSLYTRTEIFLILWGFIFFIEALSVIIQVAYFKLTKWILGEGRRVFKMTPIHHHFELLGWSEPQVVTRFGLIQLWISALGLWIYALLRGLPN